MLLLSLLALAVVDSINPSAIAVTLYLLSREHVAAQVLAYVAAIFLTYLTLGVVMASGLDMLLPAVQTMDRRVEFIVQGVIGLGLLLYALLTPATSTSTPRAEPRASTYAALALLGVTVTAMELPTALPYFGAIALLTAADLPMAQWLTLLVAYNAVFVLPPVLLLVGHLALGHRLNERYAGLKERLQAGARETMLWVAGLVGGGLLASSVVELVARAVK